MLNVKITITPKVDIPPVQYYQHKEDADTDWFDWKVRGCAVLGCPAVFILRDAPDTIFDKQWQFYVYAINKGMRIAALTATMGDEKALMNETGFGKIGSPRANYLTGSDLNSPPPRLDKLRTFSRNSHTGTEIVSLTTGISNLLASLKSRTNIKSALSQVTAPNTLRVLTMDGNRPPALKPGKSYPNTLEQVNPDDYLYTPKTHRHLFLVCNNIRTKIGNTTSIFPWTNGIVRDWIGDGEIYTFFPLVSKYEVLSPLDRWIKYPLGSNIPYPYRRVS